MKASTSIDRRHSHSLFPKLAFWFLHALVLVLGAWLAFGDGLHTLGSWIGQPDWKLSDPSRARWVLACEGVYFLRHGVTLFLLMQRRVGWGEVLGLATFIGLIDVAFVLAGGGAWQDEPAHFGFIDYTALVVYVVGSFLNSGSEIQRRLWKLNPAHHGHCYTGGLFRYAMHINYFGDVLLFTGLALLTHNAWTLLVPAGMFGSFVVYHIPTLDAYLEQRYGDEFRRYRQKTRRLIPFVW